MSIKIVFIGAAGCGKSTLASEVFTTLKKKGINTEAIHEFIRHDIQINGPMTSVWEQYRTRMHQQELEDAVPSSVDYVVVDSGTLTPYFYTALYCDATNARQRLVLRDMYKMLIDDLFLDRYQYIFYLPFQEGTNTNDGTRYQTSDELNILDEHMRLVFSKIFKLSSVSVIDGPFDGRLEKIMNILALG